MPDSTPASASCTSCESSFHQVSATVAAVTTTTTAASVEPFGAWTGQSSGKSWSAWHQMTAKMMQHSLRGAP